MASSVIVEAPHVERIGAFEAEYDPILIVDAHGVEYPTFFKDTHLQRVNS
jgi:hypothetical protein